MEEQQRLSYLEALGIQQWVPRVSLPHAKVSEYLSIDETSVADDQAERASSELGSVELKGQAPTIQAEQAVVVPANERVNAEPNRNKQEEAFSISAHVLGKKGHYLMLVDSLGLEILSSEDQHLLHNIEKAWDSLLGIDAENNILPEKFKWPMFEAHMAPKHIDQGESAGIESLNAFVFSCERRYRNKYLLVLGKELQGRLSTDKLSSKVIFSQDISTLQAKPTYKVELWKMLQATKEQEEK